jgi:transglutaminase-like putative cysteine protease
MRQSLFRRWDWYTAILLVLIVSSAVGRLSVTNWTRELGYIETIALAGVLLGLALGISRFGSRTVRWLVLGCSMIVVPWQTIFAITDQMTVRGRLNDAWGRSGLVFERLAASTPIDDPILLALLLSLLYWSVGVYCGYRLVRGARLLNVLAPPTILILVVQYYDGYEVDRMWFIALYFFLVLLLIGRVNILRNRETWEAKRILTGSEPAFDLGKSILVAAVLVVMIAWLLPTPAAALPAAARAWQQVNEPFETLREWINETLVDLRTGTGVGMELYGNHLGLGLSANQGTHEVFTVAVPNTDLPRYYWQMRIYDLYEDGNWSNSSHVNRAFSPDDANVQIPSSGSAQTQGFSFSWKGSKSSLLVIPSQPVWASLAGSIRYEDAGPGEVDVLSWHLDSYVQETDEYQARAALLNPSVNDLQNAGNDYPGWVTQRYLQLPEPFSTRIRALANELASGEPAAYGKVTAVTNYLRQEIKYNYSVPSSPPGMEPLEWFLFTWKSGYCNYYASAEVLMLRSLGIPARLAVGYAQGEENDDGTFTVFERDAHAWPQVYFPAIGWVDFEPTASQPPIERRREPAGRPNAPTPLPEEQAANPPSKQPQAGHTTQNSNTIATYQTIRVWVIISIIVLSVIGGGVWLLNRKEPLGRRIPRVVRAFYQHNGLSVPTWLKRWERWSEVNVVERSFHAINQSLAWLGKPQPAHVTPAERAELLKNLLPSLTDDIETLKEQHEQTLFSPTPGDAAKAVRAAWRIRYLTIRAMVRRFVGANDE